jgi:glutaredoxin
VSGRGLGLDRGLAGGTRLVACACALGLALAATVAVGCSRNDPDLPKKEPAAAGPLVVRDDTQGLLFTWIDAKGDFHVEETADKVPSEHRDMVRVLEPTRAEEPDQIAVVDLRATAKGPDGAYPVTSKPRASFEAVAVGRRNALRADLAAKAPSGAAGPSGAGAGHGASTGGGAAERPGAKKTVTVYGASWCGACQKTRAYLKQKGVAFADKDIDADSSAAREMRVKLSKAGIEGRGIPVIDIGGAVMVGFDARAIDRALSGG